MMIRVLVVHHSFNTESQKINKVRKDILTDLYSLLCAVVVLFDEEDQIELQHIIKANYSCGYVFLLGQRELQVK